MIGNDIIDLTCAKSESNWRRKGYLNKIFTDYEQKEIISHTKPDILIWILWSMKEAAYKANHRITNVKEYSPTKIRCNIINNNNNNIYNANVDYNGIRFNTQTQVFEDYIHTVSLYNSNDFSKIKEINIKNYPENYISYISEMNYLKSEEYILKDKNGIPNLHNNTNNIIKPISISHHGKFLSIIVN